jgi:malonyl-CoA O-methyltransferase
MNLHKVQVAHRFNRSATIYDQYAIVQKQMAHQLLRHLQKCKPSVQRICEIGCGTGYLTNLLTKLYPEADLVAIDLAPQMIEIAKSRVTSPNVHWIVGDAEELHQNISQQFDLIVSNATIQWLSHPKETLNSWVEALHPDGWVIASTFGNDTFQELVTTFQKVEMELEMQPSQHHLTMHSALFWKQVWEQTGLTSIDVEEDWQRVPYPNCRTFMQRIKATGANYSEPKQPLLHSRRLLQNVMKKYDQIYRMGSLVYATYHALHLYGQKK